MSYSYNSLVGCKVGLLTVKSIEATEGRPYAICVCECGNEKRVRADHIRHEETKSCGCEWHAVHRKHGMVKSKEYYVWNAMRQRCSKPTASYYEAYGGRGIRVCDAWNASFEAFFGDMGPRPSSEHSIERRNNDGNYEPANCYWATREEQASNTRKNRFVVFNGERLTHSQAVRKAGVTRWKLRNLPDGAAI